MKRAILWSAIGAVLTTIPTLAPAQYNRNPAQVALSQGDSPYRQGLAMLEAGDYERAIASFTAAITDDPSDVFPYLKRAKAYEESGARARAIADYRTAGEVNRDSDVRQMIAAAIKRLSSPQLSRREPEPKRAAQENGGDLLEPGIFNPSDLPILEVEDAGF